MGYEFDMPYDPSELVFPEVNVPYVVSSRILTPRSPFWVALPDGKTARQCKTIEEACATPGSLIMMQFDATIVRCQGRVHKRSTIPFLATDKLAWSMGDVQASMWTAEDRAFFASYHEKLNAAQQGMNTKAVQDLVNEWGAINQAAQKRPHALNPSTAIDPEKFFRGGWKTAYKKFMKRLVGGK